MAVKMVERTVEQLVAWWAELMVGTTAESRAVHSVALSAVLKVELLVEPLVVHLVELLAVK